MVSLKALTLAVFASLSLAAPLENSKVQDLVPRQSTTWQDSVTLAPKAFAAQAIGGCNYQVTFHRDGFDSRHYLRFFATYPGSSQKREVKPESGSWYVPRTDSTDYGLYTLPEKRVLSIHTFRNICSSGSSGNAPTNLFVRVTMKSGYTVFYDYISPAITPVTATLPPPPTNVQVRRTTAPGKTYTVTWNPVSSATGGYYVLIRFGIYAYELSGFVPGTRTILTSPGQTSATFQISGRDQLETVVVSSQAATDVVTDPTTLSIVFPVELAQQ